MSDKIPVRKSELWKRTSEEGGIVVDTVRAIEHTLNDTALRIFELCDGESSISDIAEMLTKEYEVDLETARNDVTRVAEKLEELNVLTFK
jgi:hypothetical protein